MKIRNHLLARLVSLASLSVAVPLYAAPGYNGGQSLPTTTNQTIIAANHGVIANDGLDDSSALQAIIDGISINNSPSNLIKIVLPAGEINIGDEVHVDRSGIIIEGAGSNPQSGTSITVSSWQPYTVTSGNAPDFDRKFWPGFAAFRAETRIKHPNDNLEGSINFHWKHSIEFGAPASIGDTVLTMDTNGGDKFNVGDLIYVGAANDDAFLDLGQVPNSKRNNKNITTGHMRTQIFKVVAINASQNKVTIDRPLEFDVELQNSSGYNSRVMPVTAVQNVGFRNFHMVMDNVGTGCANYNSGNLSSSNPNGVGFRYENLCPADAIHGILFKWAYNGFVDNVSLEMTGSHPIVTEFAKNMTFSNNAIDGSWNKGAGGNGYFRGSKLYDSWIVGNTIENVRHLTLQWSATGNLVEGNQMNADFNLHGGWERNNMIRNNVISVPFEHRSWSNGAPGNGTWQPIWYASGDHASNWAGPTGPNNAFVNNTLRKALSAGAPITTWGLFDTPNTVYRLGWDGTGYQHLSVDGNPVPTWTQELAEGVYSQIPNSGVFIETLNSNDNDNDGVNNNADQCPNTPAGTTVSSDGCAVVVNNDDDNDGVVNSIDQCPNTSAGVVVDTSGCEIIDADDDGDDVPNSVDQCLNTAPGVTVDENGCEVVDGDDDNDGVVNSIDECPNTQQGADVDGVGCAVIVNPGACSSIIDVPWNSRSEVTLNGNESCLRFDRNLSGERLQVWDSDTNPSCDFRGSVTSVDGSGSVNISSNYVAVGGFSGTTLKFTSTSNCSFVKVRAY